MSFPIYTAILAGFLIILQQILMVLAGMHRAKVGIGVGHGEDKDLERKVRRHGNLAENSALFLIVLALAELYGVPGVGIVAAVFGVARISHALAFSSLSGSHLPTDSKLFPALRIVGAMGTLLSGIALGGFLLICVLIIGA